MVATSEQKARRAAQRRLAKQIHTGTYKPSGIGAKSRRISGEHERLIKTLQDFKNQEFGRSGQFNQQKSDRTARINPESKKHWTTEELRKIVASISAEMGRTGEIDWEVVFGEMDQAFKPAFYYH